MMYNAICPKCGSREIVRINGYTDSYGAGNNIRTGAFTHINVNRYICCQCGFTEEWIDKSDLQKLVRSKKAMHVNSVQKQPYGFY